MDIRTKSIDQKLEIDALRSIYRNEFKVLRPKKRNIYEPLKCTIFVGVKECDGPAHPIVKSLKILFDCPRSYPDDPPEFSFNELENVNDSDIEPMTTRMRQSLIKPYNELLIHNLVEICRTYLREVIDKDLVEINEEKEKELNTNLNLFREPTDLFKVEVPKNEPCHHVYNEENSKPVNFKTSDKSHVVKVNVGACKGFHKVKVIDSKCIIVFNTFSGYNLSKGHNVLIRQICLKITNDTEKYQYLEQFWLPKLQDDLGVLYKLSHPHIAPYLGHRINTIHNKKKKQLILQLLLLDDCCIQSLRQYCDNLCQIHSENNRLAIETIYSIIGDIADAIKYLHDKSITFVRIDLDSIMIDRNLRIRLTEYSIGKRIRELKSSDDQDRKHERSKSGNSISNDDANESDIIKKGSKKYDIWQLARISKQLYFYGVPPDSIDEADMTSELFDFINCCRECGDSNIFNHSFICDRIQNNITNEHQIQVGPANNSVMGSPIPAVGASQNNNDKDNDLSAWKVFMQSSRIPTEFEIIASLGKGAFGDVVKVRNKFDNQYYAIKRVKLRNLKKKAEYRKLKEVQLLSSLNHENIVRYYATWSEEIYSDRKGGAGGSTTVTSGGATVTTGDTSSLINNVSKGGSHMMKPSVIDSDLMELSSRVNYKDKCLLGGFDGDVSRRFGLDSSKGYSGVSLSLSSSDSSDDEEDEEDEEDGEDEEDEEDDDADADKDYKVGHSQSDSLIQFERNAANQSQSESMINKDDSFQVSGTKYLMIQMELCEGVCNTLRKVIESENLYMNERLIWRFTREIVAGLEHLHNKFMIHRDLKPNNIFLDSNKRIKLGDLGLATIYNTAAATASSGPVGTSYYICPEMIARKAYDSKADMYSLGIILFEMTYPPFKTEQERHLVLNKLRLPDILFPSDSPIKYPKEKFKNLIQSLLSHNPVLRPSSNELMKFDRIPPPEAKEMELRNQILQITNNPSSSLYKLLLQKMFTQPNINVSSYGMLLYLQSPYKHFIANSKYDLWKGVSNNSSGSFNKDAFMELIHGDFRYFTVQKYITGVIESVFMSHGGILLSSPLMNPRYSMHAASFLYTQTEETSTSASNTNHIRSSLNQPISLLDTEGVVVNLPNNLRDNFIQFLISYGINNCRRYDIGHVYRQQDDYRGYHPRQMLEAVFDIITSISNPNSFVETIYMMANIVDRIFSSEITVTLELNDTRLLLGIMTYFKVPPYWQSKLLDQYQNKKMAARNKDVGAETSASSFPHNIDSDKLKQDTGISDSQLQFLRQLLSYHGDLIEFKKYLKTFSMKANENEMCRLIQSGYDDLVGVYLRLQAIMKIKQVANDNSSNLRIQLKVAMLPDNSKLYNGPIFQLVANANSPLVNDIVTMPLNVTNSLLLSNTNNPTLSNIAGSINTDSSSYKKSLKAINKFLRTPKVICVGGCYGDNLVNCTNCNVGVINQNAYNSTNNNQSICDHLHGVGVTFELSSIIQLFYSLHFVNIKLTKDVVGLTIVDVLIKYSADMERQIWELLTSFWDMHISAVLYDEREKGEIFTQSNRVPFLLELHQPVTSDTTRLLVTRGHDCTLVMDEEFSNYVKVIQIIGQELDKSANRLNPILLHVAQANEQPNTSTFSRRKSRVDDIGSSSSSSSLIASTASSTLNNQIGALQSSTNNSIQSLSNQSNSNITNQLQSSSMPIGLSNATSNTTNISNSSASSYTSGGGGGGSTNHYIYKFAYSRDTHNTKSAPPQLDVGYIAESQRHLQSIQMKNRDLSHVDLRYIERANQILITHSKWFMARSVPPIVYVIFADISLAKFNVCVSYASLRNLKDSNFKLQDVYEAADKRGHNPGDRGNWKDVLNKVWYELQVAAREKAYRIMLYSISESHHIMFELR